MRRVGHDGRIRLVPSSAPAHARPGLCPDKSDVWKPVTFKPSLRRSSVHESPSSTSSTPRRGRALGIGALAAVLVLGGGSLAVAGAHKTVTLDINGEPVEVSTFAGSVDGLLENEAVTVGERDLVAPAVDSSLQDGDEIVVRHARQVTVLADGEEARLWTTALTADDALQTFAGRGDDVRLMASRSSGEGRADLAVLLAGEGPVDVVVDGETHEVADGSVGLEQVLSDLDITVGELDRVSVERDEETGRVIVRVERVVAEEVSKTHAIEFSSTTEETADLYTDETEVAVEGQDGERTTVHRVITVDGEEESRLELSDTVTVAPVEEVVRVGTSERPAPEPAPAPVPAATPANPAPAAPAPAPAAVVNGDVWAQLAQCESGGNPTIVSSNGLYHGLYQFSVATWQAVGGAGLPSEASPAEQTQRAQALQAQSGWGQWPACSTKLGLR
ncbi:resuscitation-promoting factor [Actinotalea sp. C106]|uniref:resuscitation-promoting factor n=1 Tax=Actinotalea sp. C106 TaxID=2908644 RepID=UPI0025400C87|nr:resuscitation-promoting factor [Actinotalea sp. C106]